MTTAMPLWARVYLQYFDRPRDFDPEAVESVLNRQLGEGEWTEAKLCDAMEWMRSEEQKGKWKSKMPNAHILSIAYKCYCKQKAWQGTTYSSGGRQGQLERIKSMMRWANTPLKRFSIMVDPEHYIDQWMPNTTGEECRNIEDWAVAEGLLPKGYRPTLEEVVAGPSGQDVVDEYKRERDIEFEPPKEEQITF